MGLGSPPMHYHLQRHVPPFRLTSPTAAASSSFNLSTSHTISLQFFFFFAIFHIPFSVRGSSILAPTFDGFSISQPQRGQELIIWTLVKQLASSSSPFWMLRTGELKLDLGTSCYMS
ncbi:uncharacterized protein LOC129312942 [Prosopis cineraria]|uniref:uncharacterized protein LOC129312942 n=1 Tax=Prosopis cineraria TaxID=364024 RepID=UPI00240F5456|nr:uncharacterized protein LOC129312942 [Prosopis cineraria]